MPRIRQRRRPPVNLFAVLLALLVLLVILGQFR